MGLYFWDGNEHIPEVKVMVDLQKGEYFFGGGGDDGGGDDDDGGDDGGGGGQSRAGLLKGFLPLKEVSTRSSLHHHCFSSTLRLNHFAFCDSFKGNVTFLFFHLYNNTITIVGRFVVFIPIFP